MRRAEDQSGTKFTIDPSGAIVPVAPKPAPAPTQVSENGQGQGGPSLPPGVTQAQIDASIAANPQAAGANGSWFTGDFRTSSGGGDTSSAPTPVIDWSQYLNIFGLPADVQAEINRIFTNTPDLNQATSLAMGYVRGTPWYKQTYPGIQEAIAKGVVTNEADYRNYLNNANQLYQQYYGRAIGTDEFSGLISRGIDLTLLNKQLASGENLAELNKFNSSGLFTGDELGQIAANNAGLGSQQGTYLNGLLNFAHQVSPIYAQYGAPLSRQMIETNYKNGVTADTISRQLAGGSFINANRNDIQYASGAFGDGQLNDTQLTAYGNTQAGLGNPEGDAIDVMVRKAQQRLQGVFSGRLADFLGPQGNRRPDVAA